MRKKWNVLPSAEPAFLKDQSDYPPVIRQILWHRGITEKKKIEEFLDPDYFRDFLDPFLFRNMEEAVDLIIRHIKAKHKIFVYGDYDADGITATAVLFETLKKLKADAEAYIPYRLTEGYGLNKNAISHIAASQGKLIITVDTGIRNKPQVDHAKSKGIDVIITDHHSPPPEKGDYPDCLIIDPLAANETYPYKSLAGCGIAFKLAKALISRTKLSEEHKRILEIRLLDLVAIGTVADVVSLLGENRIIVKKGLEVLGHTKRIGLKELISTAQISDPRVIDTWNIGFQIGPRINAAGRLEHANTSLELLITNDKEEATSLARSLNRNNAKRQEITDAVAEEIEAGLEGKPIKEIIVAVSPSFDKKSRWNEGVIGLIAGRISDKFHRPCIVITGGEKYIKGSGRSIREFNLIKAVEETKDHLLKYGGHPAACGIQLKEENLQKFIARIEEIAERELKGKKLAPSIDIDAELELSGIGDEFYGYLAKLAPFGQDNQQPRFVSKNVTIADIITMGSDNQHIKFRVKSDNSGLFTAVAFNKSETFAHVNIKDKIDMVYYLERNNFNGRSEIQLKIIDIKKLSI